MSEAEAHVQGIHNIGLVDSINSTSIKNNNNNNNDCENINKSKPKSNNNDEIIEEFDFSDSDLVEFGNADDSSDGSESADSNNSKNKIDSNVEQSQKKKNNNMSEIGADVSAVAVRANKSGDACSAADVAIAATAAAASTNDNKSSTSANKRKSTPANLELPAAGIADSTGAADTFCPITPRHIVDIEPDDSAPLFFGSAPKASEGDEAKGDTHGTAVTSADVADDHEDDADDYNDEQRITDNPDDELLVEFLDEANRIAEARLAARRQARAEAREIRMRELERQQKEQEHNADRVFDMQTVSGIDPMSRSRLAAGIGSSPIGGVLNTTRGNSMSSRRSSEDSLEEEGRSLRDIRHELKDVEERFRKAMIANAQLDNERASQTYQIQLLKDKLEEMEECYAQLQREFKEKSRDCNALKRNLDKLNEELKLVQGQLNERDSLITEQGLVIVAVENEEGTDAKRALVSMENAQLLGSVQGSLDVRLKKFSEEKQQLVAEVQQLQEQLENCKSQGKGRGNSINGPSGADEDYEAQREANKVISDYKYKLQKAEQEVASLQASLARSETQVIRYKSTAEAAEKAEVELKIERRKLQRENREAMERLEELETSNNHLLKRLDKLKNAKSALLKDL